MLRRHFHRCQRYLFCDLTKYNADLTKSYASLARFYTDFAKSYASLARFYTDFVKF